MLLDVRANARTAERVRRAVDARQISAVLHGSGPVPIAADRGGVEMILNSLVSNATKHDRDRARVDLDCRPTHGASR